MGPGVTAISAAGLRKTYGDLVALDGLDLAIDRGEVFGVLGPNGAGKTTTMEILTGQTAPDAGEAEVLGVDPVADPVAVRERVGILPEQESPPSFLTPREYFDFVGAVRDVPDDDLDARVDEWADRLAFAEKLDTLCTDLSRGQQQKVMMTAAFLHDPDAVFIDEPLVNLDPIVQERAKRHVVEFAEAGNAVFLSTHHIEIAAEICTRVGIVTDGRLREERRPADEEPGALLEAFVDRVEGGADVVASVTDGTGAAPDAAED